MLLPYLMWTFLLTAILRGGDSNRINSTQTSSPIYPKQRKPEHKLSIRLDIFLNGAYLTDKSDTFTRSSKKKSDGKPLQDSPMTCRVNENKGEKIIGGLNRIVKAITIQPGVLAYPSNSVLEKAPGNVEISIPDSSKVLPFSPKELRNKAFWLFHGKRNILGHFHEHDTDLGNRHPRLHKRSILSANKTHAHTIKEQANEKMETHKRYQWKHGIRSSPYYGWKRLSSNWGWYEYGQLGHSLDTLASNIIGKRAL